MQQPHFDVMAELQDLCWDSPLPEEIGTAPVAAPKPLEPVPLSATLNSLDAPSLASLKPLKQKQQSRPKVNRIRGGGIQGLASTSPTRGKSGFGGTCQYQQGYRCDSFFKSFGIKIR
jgi:hypothetical protein